MARKDTPNDPYSTIAHFYDEIMGLRSDIPLVEKLLKKHAPKATSLLELACGKATVLAPLSRYFDDVTGLDISEPMLERARYCLPHADFIQGDMRDFSLTKTFDIVICVFDSLNHLTKFSDWESVFSTTAKHLNDGGLFLFDINTKHRFQTYQEDSPFVDYVDDHICIFDVEPLKGGKFVLDIQFLENEGGQKFTRHQAAIVERTFENDKILKSLKKFFDKISIVDERGKKPRVHSESLYFICQK